MTKTISTTRTKTCTTTSTRTNAMATTNGNTVPTRAAQWISRLLATNEKNSGLPRNPSRNVVLDDRGGLDLSHLIVSELKRIAKEIRARTMAHHYNENSSPVVPLFEMPKSSAKKAEWISAISSFLCENDSNFELYNVLKGIKTGGKKLGGGSAVSMSAAAPRATRNSPVAHAPKNRATPDKKTKAKSPAKLKSAGSATPHAARIPSKSPQKIAHKKSPPKCKLHSATNAVSTHHSLLTSKFLKGSLEEADEAMAKMLQDKYDKEDEQFAQQPSVTTYMGLSSGYPRNVASLSQSHFYNYHGGIPPPRPSFASITTTVSSTAASAGANGIQPLGSQLDCKPASVKVKKEPETHATTTATTTTALAQPPGLPPAAAFAPAVSSTYSNNDDAATPRNFREQSMVNALRNMGFTDVREMLNGLRAVASQREEISSVPNLHCLTTNDWSQEEQIDAAMMWIVSQREEVAEAQKLDEARISSERTMLAMERTRKENEEEQIQNASITDLIGSVDGVKDTKSKFFSSSVLLRSNAVRQFFSGLISCGSKTAKEQVVRLLKLEKKARKWYGTVLPFSYFEYVLCPRMEDWANEIRDAECIGAHLISIFVKKVGEESIKLENAMFNLSEQEESGVGMAPKMFLSAQRDAASRGRPTCLAENASSSDDVEVIDFPSRSSSSSDVSGEGAKIPVTNRRSKNAMSSLDAIEIM